MIKNGKIGMSDNDYWESLIDTPKDDEQLMLSIAAQMALDGQKTLASEYSERGRVAAAHNKIIRIVAGFGRDNRRDFGARYAGCLIHNGWKPPPDLMLTDEGKKVVARHNG